MSNPLGEPTPLPPAIEARLDALIGALPIVMRTGDGYDCYNPGAVAFEKARAALSTEIGKEIAEAELGADDLQGEVDELADWQRRVCELLTPEGDRGALSSELAEARIEELLRIERAAPAKVIDAARRSTPSETPDAASRPPAPRTAQ